MSCRVFLTIKARHVTQRDTRFYFNFMVSQVNEKAWCFWMKRTYYTLFATNNFLLIQFYVYLESAYAYKFVTKFCSVNSLFFSTISKHFATIAYKNQYQKMQDQFPFFNVRLNFLRSSREFDCNATLGVIESVLILKERVQGFNKSVVQRLTPGPRQCKCDELESFMTKKNELPLCKTLFLQGKIFLEV